MARAWLNSSDIINAIKRKIAVPISQNTFSNQDLLEFCNEEMQIALVPQVLSYHEEYFVENQLTALEDGVIRYPIPDRAVGMRLRNIFYVDSNGNPFEMVRINPEDKSYFLNNNSNTDVVFKYYLEGNDVVLLNQTLNSPTGSLQFNFYLRPNQLVEEDRAAIISSFGKTLQVVNASLSAGDTVTIDEEIFIVGTDFAIGGTSSVTASNLANAINTNGVAVASASTDTVTIAYSNRNIDVSTSNAIGFVIAASLNINMTDVIPDNITTGSLVDILQTKSGHRTRNYDVLVPSNGVSGATLKLDEDDVPSTVIVGDYVASENECIIPQIPSDLHIGLVERACARILQSLGDQIGLAATNQKIQDIEGAQSTLLDNRVDGSPQKVLARNTLLRRGKMIYSRKI